MIQDVIKQAIAEHNDRVEAVKAKIEKDAAEREAELKLKRNEEVLEVFGTLEGINFVNNSIQFGYEGEYIVLVFPDMMSQYVYKISTCERCGGVRKTAKEMFTKGMLASIILDDRWEYHECIHTDTRLEVFYLETMDGVTYCLKDTPDMPYATVADSIYPVDKDNKGYVAGAWEVRTGDVLIELRNVTEVGRRLIRYTYNPQLPE